MSQFEFPAAELGARDHSFSSRIPLLVAPRSLAISHYFSSRIPLSVAPRSLATSHDFSSRIPLLVAPRSLATSHYFSSRIPLLDRVALRFRIHLNLRPCLESVSNLRPCFLTVFLQFSYRFITVPLEFPYNFLQISKRTLRELYKELLTVLVEFPYKCKGFVRNCKKHSI